METFHISSQQRVGCLVAAAATQFTNQPHQTGRQDTYYLPHCHHQTGGKTHITYHTAHVMLPHITLPLNSML